jgi:uncharacterized coiled-coil protein SlyX
MPIPYRLKDEAEPDFVMRCMSDELMAEEFEDMNDRLKVCSIQARYEDAPKPGLSRLKVKLNEGGKAYQVNQDNGEMQGVSLIQVGEAKGHELFIDQTSLETALEVLGENLPAYITHEGAMNDDRILREVGVFSGFFIEGDRLKAKSFNALESFRQDEPNKYNRLFDIAKAMPDTFGVSLVFEAEVVFVFEDGTEIPADELSMEEQEKAVREFPSVRFRSIKSADFVDAPAANKNGLFSINTTTQKTIMAEDTGTELEQVEEAAEEVATEANPLEEKLAELEERVGSYEEKIAKLTGELSEAQSVNEKLSSFIDFGEEAIEESTDEAKPAETLVDQLSSVEGYELTKLFREQKEKIFSQFNQKRG